MSKNNSIKIIKCGDIEIPVEYLKQTIVSVNGDDYIRLQQENKQLKENWNKLKEYIEKDYDFYDKLIAPKYGCAMGALRRIKDKMQKLEQGSDK